MQAPAILLSLSDAVSSSFFSGRKIAHGVHEIYYQSADEIYVGARAGYLHRLVEQAENLGVQDHPEQRAAGATCRLPEPFVHKFPLEAYPVLLPSGGRIWEIAMPGTRRKHQHAPGSDGETAVFQLEGAFSSHEIHNLVLVDDPSHRRVEIVSGRVVMRRIFLSGRYFLIAHGRNINLLLLFGMLGCEILYHSVRKVVKTASGRRPVSLSQN